MSEAEEELLVSELRQIDREIAKVQQLIREVPVAVLMPQAGDALERIQKRIGALAVPTAALTPQVTTLTPGTLARVKGTGEPVRVISAGIRVLSPPTEVRLVINAKGEVTMLKPEDLEEAVSVAPPPTEQVSSPGPLPLGPEKPPVASLTTTTLKPGDLVETPFGRGTVTTVNPQLEAGVEVEIPGQSRFYMRPGEVRLSTTTP